MKVKCSKSYNNTFKKYLKCKTLSENLKYTTNMIMKIMFSPKFRQKPRFP